jgi:hypothetical protein
MTQITKIDFSGRFSDSDDLGIDNIDCQIPFLRLQVIWPDNIHGSIFNGCNHQWMIYLDLLSLLDGLNQGLFGRKTWLAAQHD